MMAKSEVENKVDFSTIRYAQVWEDADVLIKGLNIQPNDVCLSIASAGDNALAMLAKNPEKVIAIDLNPAQIFCLEMRVVGYRVLEYHQLLEFMGSRPSQNRKRYYEKCKGLLTKEARHFWDNKQDEVEKYGIGGIGKFERYFRIFKDCIMTLVHTKETVKELSSPKSLQERAAFFDRDWNTWQWRLLVRFFFSQTLMGAMGRDPAFFAYVDGCFTKHVFQKIKHGMCTMSPEKNPYLHWILHGGHGQYLPYSLRRENFESIKNNLDKLEWHVLSTEGFAKHCRQRHVKISKHNLSNIFEYMSEDNYCASLSSLINISEPGARMLYWNMMVPRSCPNALRHKLKSHDDIAKNLHIQDKAFFYNKLVIEEVL